MCIDTKKLTIYVVGQGLQKCTLNIYIYSVSYKQIIDFTIKYKVGSVMLILTDITQLLPCLLLVQER